MYLISRTDSILPPKAIPMAPQTLYHQRLFALDITTGENVKGKRIEKPVTAFEITPNLNDGRGDFLAQWQNQRSALALANGRVYAAWAGECDTNLYHGWVMAFDADPRSKSYLQLLKRFNSTPDSDLKGEGGGIWQAGQGPAVDGKGNLYVITGNGDLNRYRRFGNDMGDSFIKLRPDLSVGDYFSPSNQRELDGADYDLGSAGPLLVPTGNLRQRRPGHPAGGGKECKFFLLDPDHLGGFDCRRDHVYQEAFVNPSTYLLKYPLPSDDGQGAMLTNHIHGGPVFWNSAQGGMIYVWPENEHLKAYRLDPARATLPTGVVASARSEAVTTVIPKLMRFPGSGAPMAVFPSFVPFVSEATPTAAAAPALPVATPSAQSVMTACEGMPGGCFRFSRRVEKRSGVIWANLPMQDAYIIEKGNVPGMLAAFDASTLKLLWTSDGAAGDKVGDYAKYVPPTVARGKVYLATFSGKIDVYGLKAAKRKQICKSQSRISRPVRKQSGTLFSPRLKLD